MLGLLRVCGLGPGGWNLLFLPLVFQRLWVLIVCAGLRSAAALGLPLAQPPAALKGRNLNLAAEP